MFPLQFQGCLVYLPFVNPKFYLSVYICGIESCLRKVYIQIFLMDAEENNEMLLNIVSLEAANFIEDTIFNNKSFFRCYYSTHFIFL
jgi:hypothetical protein